MIPRYRFAGDLFSVNVHRIPDPGGDYVRHEHLERLLERIAEIRAYLITGQADKARVTAIRALEYANLQEHSE